MKTKICQVKDLPGMSPSLTWTLSTLSSHSLAFFTASISCLTLGRYAGTAPASAMIASRAEIIGRGLSRQGKVACNVYMPPTASNNQSLNLYCSIPHGAETWLTTVKKRCVFNKDLKIFPKERIGTVTELQRELYH